MKHWLSTALAAFALISCNKKASEPQSNAVAPAASQAPVKGPDRSHRGKAMPAARFNDPDGNEASLDAFKSKPTLVNLWATWCAPCVKELPTLDRLAARTDGKLNVVAISQDFGPQPSVEAFLREHKLGELEAYHDPKMALSAALGPDTVLPTSILYDANGKEVWRYVGELDWTSDAAARLLAEGGASTGR